MARTAEIWGGLVAAVLAAFAAGAAATAASAGRATAAGAAVGAFLLVLAWARVRIDLAARRQVERELRASEARFRGLVRDVPVGVLVLDPEGRPALANPKALELLGVSESQMFGRAADDPAWDVVDESGRVLGPADTPVARAVATRRIVRDAVLGVRREADGERVWLLVNADPGLAEDGTIVEVLCTFHDISERKAAESRLEQANAALQRLSLVDAVTDVANRRQFDRALSDEWARGTRAGTSLALVVLDVDHFKAYNDHYGHPAGDECLKRIAAVLSRTLLRAGDLVARYGGEEFAAVLPLTDADAATAIAERMRRSVEALVLPHAAVPLGAVTVSAGVAACRPDVGMNALDLLARADAALYEAKAAGRNRVVTASEADLLVLTRPSRG